MGRTFDKNPSIPPSRISVPYLLLHLLYSAMGLHIARGQQSIMVPASLLRHLHLCFAPRILVSSRVWCGGPTRQFISMLGGMEEGAKFLVL